MVAAGVTVDVPAAETEPIPWSMISALALDTLQLSTEVLPDEMVVGLAVNEFTVGAPPPNGQLIHDASRSGRDSTRAISKYLNLPFIILNKPPE
jgi:hypothetical protein